MTSRPRTLAVVAALASLVVGPGLVGAEPLASYAAPGDVTAAKPKPGDTGPGGKGKGDKGDDGKGGKGGKGDEPKPDRRAPAAPTLGSATPGPDGQVSLPVSAEVRARVVVRERGGPVVATTTATGDTQTLTWTTTTGTHSYAVTATDRAGNRSRAATFSVDADATAPLLRRVRVAPGTPEDSRSRLAFRTEAAASYRVLVDGTQVDEGTAESEAVRLPLDVADGRHDVAVEVRDAVGNLTADTATLRVRIPALAVDTEVVTEPTERLQRVTVAATPNATRGVLRVPGRADTRFRLEEGQATVRVRLPDGSYDPVTVTVRDSQGRSGTADLGPVEVDTTAPEVAVSIDQEAAAEGLLRAVIDTEAGATLRWELMNRAGIVVDFDELVAADDQVTVERDVDRGEYRLEVRSTDEFDRESRAQTTATVADDPWPTWLVVLVVAGAVVAGVVVLAGGFLLLRRLWRGPLARRRARRRDAREVAAYRRQQEAQAVSSSDRWRTRQEALETFLQVADAGLPETSLFLPGFTLVGDERVRHSTAGRLYEPRAEQDLALEAHDGELVITDRRVVFVGEDTRDWWCGLVAGLRHVGDDRTMIRGEREEEWSGLAYADPELTRLYLDLLMAEQQGTRRDYLSRVEQELQAHALRRPGAEEPDPAHR